MQVRLADHYGMCFGVRDAIQLALDVTQREPVTILGDLVHNPDVVAKMDAAGAQRAKHFNEIKTTSVLLTAHGTSDRMKLELRQQGHQIQDATCPLVERAHKALKKLIYDGYFPVVIGKPDHVEVRGLIGDCDDVVVLFSEADVEQILDRFSPEDPEVKLGVVCQTTWPLERAEEMVDHLRLSFPKANVKFVDTVCQPTKDRQQAIRDLARESDVVVVVGGPTSNNSRKLTELARSLGCGAFQVSNADELREEWFANARVVGVTAGTSTPDDVIDAVRARLEAM